MTPLTWSQTPPTDLDNYVEYWWVRSVPGKDYPPPVCVPRVQQFTVGREFAVYTMHPDSMWTVPVANLAGYYEFAGPIPLPAEPAAEVAGVEQ